MLQGIFQTQATSTTLPKGEENSTSTIKSHVNRVNYFLRFLDSKHKTIMDGAKMMIGMISYEEIIKGLREEEAYFDSLGSSFGSEMKTLIHNFLETFEANLEFQKSKNDGHISSSDLEEAFVQIALFMLPFIIENSKTLTFLHANFLTAIADKELSTDEFSVLNEKIQKVINFFSSSTALVDLKEYEKNGLINKDNIQDFFIEIFNIIEDMSNLLNELLLLNATKSPYASFIHDLQHLAQSTNTLKISLNKMIDEKAEDEEVSQTTLKEVSDAYINFFNAIRAPRELAT